MTGYLLNKVGNRLPVYIKEYGLVKGWQVYRQFKQLSQAGISLPSIRSKIFSRGINSDMEMFHQIFLDKDYDIELPFQPRVIFDLGANVGYASLFLANKFPDATIIAVEPDADNLKIARKNLSAYPQVFLKHGAVWHQTAQISLHDEGHGEAAYIVKEGAGTNLVRAFTIKELMDEFNFAQIDLLKIDIEGAEKEIFTTGFENWLPNTRVVIVETHDRFKDGTSRAVFAAINHYHFHLEVRGENLVFINQHFPA